MRAIGAGDEPVEGHHHLENDFSIGHVGRDPTAPRNSSPIDESRKGVRIRRLTAPYVVPGEDARSGGDRRLGGDAPDFGGIEDWGKRLLATTGATWDSLKEGLAGAVEVAVVRNAYAHGGRRIDDRAAKRLRHDVPDTR
jgi:hypothetical protein